MEGAREKVASVRVLLDENGKRDALVEVDGNITLQNAKMLAEVGADIFVLGTSGIYRGDMRENIGIFQAALQS